MPNLGVSGTTQFEAMVQEAMRRMVKDPPDLDVAEIAAEVGVPKAIALGLFPNGAALYTAAAENSLIRLVDHLSVQAVQQGGNDPVAQFRAICIGYVEWAIAHPRAFEVLNSRRMFRSPDGGTERYNRAIRELTLSLLMRAQSSGRMRADLDPADTLFRVRALLHGMSTLIVNKLAGYWTEAEDVPADALRNVNDYLDSLFVPSPDQPIRSEA